MERGVIFWGPCFLQRRLAEASRCGKRRDFRQQRGGGNVSDDQSTANGETLDGSKHNYTLTFAKDSLPPVNAFWSVTMYDGKTQFLIDNSINRYLINSPMLPE